MCHFALNPLGVPLEYQSTAGVPLGVPLQSAAGVPLEYRAPLEYRWEYRWEYRAPLEYRAARCCAVLSRVPYSREHRKVRRCVVLQRAAQAAQPRAPGSSAGSALPRVPPGVRAW